MTHKIYLFSLLLMTFVLTACGETEEVNRYDNWQARSQAFMDSLNVVYESAANKALSDKDPKKLYSLVDQTNGLNVYYKKISKTGESHEKPVFTSKVSCFYRMSYFNGDVVQQNFTGKEPSGFDQPAEFELNSLISGWAYAMPNMEEGEFWTLYLPYQSGYGSGTGSDGSLLPYSALIYDVKLEKIVER